MNLEERKKVINKYIRQHLINEYYKDKGKDVYFEYLDSVKQKKRLLKFKVSTFFILVFIFSSIDYSQLFSFSSNSPTKPSECDCRYVWGDLKEVENCIMAYKNENPCVKDVWENADRSIPSSWEFVGNIRACFSCDSSRYEQGGESCRYAVLDRIKEVGGVHTGIEYKGEGVFIAFVASPTTNNNYRVARFITNQSCEIVSVNVD